MILIQSLTHNGLVLSASTMIPLAKLRANYKTKQVLHVWLPCTIWVLLGSAQETNRRIITDSGLWDVVVGVQGKIALINQAGIYILLLSLRGQHAIYNAILQLVLESTN